jgi:hypothetical protein
VLEQSESAGAPRYHRATEVSEVDDRYKLVDVTAVEVLHDHVVRLRFSDGCEGVIDLAPELWGPVFEAVAADYEYFRQVRVDPELGSIVWPNGADLAPEVLHAEAVPACAAPAAARAPDG